MAMVGEWLLYCHMRQKVWVTSLCLAVEYVGAQKFCAMLPRRHPECVDIVTCAVLTSKNRKPEFDSRIGHHVKKGKRGARRQKAATVLPNRTAAA